MATLLVESLCVSSVANVLIRQTVPPNEVKAPLMGQSNREGSTWRSVWSFRRMATVRPNVSDGT